MSHLPKMKNPWRPAAALCVALGLWAAAIPALAQKVLLDTSMGQIVIALDAAKAPKSVANFLEYVKSGHYDGTIFHRVIPDFMIEGGGFPLRSTALQRHPEHASHRLRSRVLARPFDVR